MDSCISRRIPGRGLVGITAATDNSAMMIARPIAILLPRLLPGACLTELPPDTSRPDCGTSFMVCPSFLLAADDQLPKCRLVRFGRRPDSTSGCGKAGPLAFLFYRHDFLPVEDALVQNSGCSQGIVELLGPLRAQVHKLMRQRQRAVVHARQSELFMKFIVVQHLVGYILPNQQPSAEYSQKKSKAAILFHRKAMSIPGHPSARISEVLPL